MESRKKKTGLINEWKAFAVYAVEYLGMPVEAIPFYDASGKWKIKAHRINEFILECGNFGHNREKNYSRNPIIRKLQSSWSKAKDFGQHARLFPLDSVKFFCHFLVDGIKLTIIK